MRNRGEEEGSVATAIQLLKKVNLAVMAGREPGRLTLTSSPVRVEFIYGAAGSGLCPLETALHEKWSGETLVLTVPSGRAQEFFGHLLLPFQQALGIQLMPETLCLQITVTAVQDADNREVVQFLAKSLAHGCGGSCGCGCS
jgi:hypothetical protein